MMLWAWRPSWDPRQIGTLTALATSSIWLPPLIQQPLCQTAQEQRVQQIPATALSCSPPPSNRLSSTQHLICHGQLTSALPSYTITHFYITYKWCMLCLRTIIRGVPFLSRCLMQFRMKMPPLSPTESNWKHTARQMFHGIPLQPGFCRALPTQQQRIHYTSVSYVCYPKPMGLTGCYQ